MSGERPLDTRRLLGCGWSLPPAPDRGGRLHWVDGPEKVRQSILVLLETEPGERVMRPDFGCGLRRFLMQPNTTGTRAQIKREVTRTLTQWEGRIRLESVDAEPGEDPSLVLIEIAYVHVLDGRRDTLVYPYYLE